MSASNGFLQLLRMSCIEVDLLKVTASFAGPYKIKVSPSNYTRNAEGPDDTIIRGFEFVVAVKELERVKVSPINRGDIITHSDLGDLSITEVIPMFLLGNLVGYRIRSS